MRSALVLRDWGCLWRRVVDARFEDPGERDLVLGMFASYSGPEPDRVKLAVLKVADCKREQIRRLLAVAQDDWRELLCEAEFPLSSRRSGLRERAPEKYEALLAKEQAQYEEWLGRALAT